MYHLDIKSAPSEHLLDHCKKKVHKIDHEVITSTSHGDPLADQTKNN